MFQKEWFDGDYPSAPSASTSGAISKSPTVVHTDKLEETSKNDSNYKLASSEISSSKDGKVTTRNTLIMISCRVALFVLFMRAYIMSYRSYKRTNPFDED